MATKKYLSALQPNLQKTLLKYPTLAKKLSKINLDRPTKNNRQVFQKFKEEISASDFSPSEMKAWHKVNSAIEELLSWGFNTDRNLLSAMILAGAAIGRPDLSLRSDLADNLYEARAAYAAYKLTSITSDTPGPLSIKGKSKGFSTFIQVLVEGYDRLTMHMSKGKKLDKAIKKLLEDQTIPLRVGIGFKTLDIEVLNKAHKEHFLTPRQATATRSWLGDMQSEARDSYAHSITTLNGLTFQCISTQESGVDQIFWTCLYMSIANIEQIYDLIDQAILNGTITTVDLPVQWKIQGWRSDLFKEMNAGKTRPLNVKLGQANIHNGFCPWTAVLACVEDDNSEYEAVGEVCDQVGDYAEVVSQTASTVAAMSGPSFLGAAAAAVASAAALVDLCADIVGAVVDIVNFFDNDDTIGFVYVSGNGDYILDTPPAPTPKKLDPKQLRAESRSADGAYWICVQEILSGSEVPFKRAWRYRAWDAIGDAVTHDPFGFWGGDGNDYVEVYTGPKADRILPGSFVPHEPKTPRNAAHSEWKSGPEFKAGNVKVKGTIHWGVRGENSITYSPLAKVMSFTKPEDEKFVIEE